MSKVNWPVGEVKQKKTLKQWGFLVFSMVNFGFLLFLAALNPNLPGGTCKAYAAELAPVDYCYRTIISVTNNTGGDITDRLVNFSINSSSLRTSSYLGTQAFDLMLTPSSLTPEIGIFAQDLGSTTANWWIQASGTITNGSTGQYYLSTGNASAKKDQSISMTGNDSVAVTDHADYDITDNLTLIARAFTSAGAQNATLLCKWTANTGYCLDLINSAGALRVRARVDNQSLDVAWATPTTVTEIKVTFVNPTLEILFDGVSQGTLNTGLTSITANAQNIAMGTNYTGDLNYTAIWSANVPKGVWGFEPPATTQLTAVAPVYTGTFTDEVGLHDATYTFNRVMTNITVSLSAITPQFSNSIVEVLPVFENIVGTISTTGFYTANSTYTGPIPGFAMLSSAIVDTGMPIQAGFLLIYIYVGLICAGAAILTVPNFGMLIGAAILGGIISFGAYAETIAWFWPIGYFLAAFVIFGAWLWQKQN